METEEKAPGELYEVPYARLRVVTVLEDGSFEAIAEATEDMQMDTKVTVVIDPSKVPGADPEQSGELIEFAEDDLLEIWDGAYDAEQNILYVAEIHLAEE